MSDVLACLQDGKRFDSKVPSLRSWRQVTKTNTGHFFAGSETRVSQIALIRDSTYTRFFS